MQLACSHAPLATATSATGLESVWPPPPAAARARLSTILPDPNAPARARPFWRTAFEWITGAVLEKEADAALERPFGVAVGPDGAVVVADPDSGNVYPLTSEGVSERLTCSTSEWSAPMALAYGSDGTLFVADAGLAAVARIRGKECALFGLGELERPTGVVAIGDRVHVVDPPRHQIVSFSSDGKLLSRWGSQGSLDGQFAYPSSIAAASAGQLVVTDALNFRVARLGLDGQWVTAFGAPGEGAAHFERPKGVAVDADGRVYVSDAQRDVVLVFSADGRFDYSIGEPGEGPGQFTLPSGLAVVKDRLYVADSQNRRIQVFELLGGRP
jgi:DNA-binding beta-propeller fold protein YncE